jgi:orotidine-5'-phosphate decarboxylase
VAAEFDPGNRLIAALDVASATEAEALLERLGGVPGWVKIGLELFCAAGPDYVRSVARRGLRVMLDLKLHDIPETVARAVRQVGSLGAELVTVHAGGGHAMLAAAVNAAHDTGKTRVLAVTVLTSLDEDDLSQTGLVGPVSELVSRRAMLAAQAGCDGVVASPNEIRAVRDVAGTSLIIVTPGVRPAGSDPGDQKRVATPSVAKLAGADLVVVGRPLRDAKDPAAAARAIVAELA